MSLISPQDCCCARVDGKPWSTGFATSFPDDIPNARRISWGYYANMHSSSRVSSLVTDHCLERQLTNGTERTGNVRVTAKRLEQTIERPTIFSVNSLSGIIVKSVRILNDSRALLLTNHHRHSDAGGQQWIPDCYPTHVHCKQRCLHKLGKTSCHSLH